MAEKQFAVGATRSAAYVEDEDPLAELARIVGLNDLPVLGQPFDISTPLADVPTAAPFVADAGGRRVADLEGELLRALEVYDAPRAEPVPPAVNTNQPATFSEPAPTVDPAHVTDTVDDPSIAVSQPIMDEPAPAVAQATFGSDDLEQELLESLGQANFAVSATSAPAEPVAVPAAAAQPMPPKRPPPPSFRSDGSFRLPMATFRKPSEDTPREQPVNPAPAAIADDPVPLDMAPVDVDDMAPAAAPIAAAPRADQRGDDGIDALLDEVARYEVPASRRPASSGLLQDPAFRASLAAITGVAADIPTSDTAPSQETLRREPEISAEPARPEFAAGAEEPDLENIFGPGDFELDLDAFEQQLSELSLDDEMEPVRGQSIEEALQPFAEFVGETVAHAQRADAVAITVSSGSVAMQELIAADLSTVVPGPTPAAPAVSSAPEYALEENVPFDPAMLPESEDVVEALGELDVPEMQGEPAEEPAVKVPEYDLDIDAEMANLFSSPSPLKSLPQAVRSPPTVSDVEAHLARQLGLADKTSALPAGDLDEFERALENDFRKMLSQPLGQPSEMTGAALSFSEMKNPAPERRTFRSVLLAASATGALALACVGGYLLLSGDIAEIASSEPRIIAADKGPVKVVPENPGGVTVPNQDKAVYDRVAGKEADVVKQSTLVTTNEEPIDVVQKTLVPETAVASEAENEPPSAPAATPVDDTTDARLLPTETPAPAVTDTGDQSAALGGIAVRKVRTMIVKPDGTLVPREDTPVVQNEAAASPSLPQSGAQSASEIPATVPKTAAALTAGSASVEGAIAAEAPGAPADAKIASADPLASSEEIASVADAATPADGAGPSELSDSAPIPLPRPADQPVNVTGTVTENGNVRQASDASDQAALAMAAAATPATGSYGVQIASLPSEADAMASIPRLSAKFGNVLGGRNIAVRKADIAGKGTFYRLRVDVGSKQDAIDLCLKLKSAGGSCLVSR